MATDSRLASFPMFASGISVSGTQRHIRPSQLNVPVTIADVSVNPQDIIMGDANGVVSIPLQMLDQVVEEVEKGQVLDARCLAELESGTTIRETFDKHRKWGFTTIAK